MSEKQINLKVITPRWTILDKMVDFVLFRTSEGDMGVLHGHERFTAPLASGMVRAFIEKEECDVMAVLGGFVQVEDNCVTIISSLADSSHKIEGVLEEMEMERFKARRDEKVANLETYQAQNEWRRTLVGMDVSSYSIIKGRADKGGSSGESNEKGQ